MGIKDYRPPMGEVLLSADASLTLRGVNLEDIQLLMRNHAADLDGIVQIMQSPVKSDSQVAMLTHYAINLIREAPLLVATLIMLCDTDNDEDDVTPYRTLSIAAQLKCIETIGELTFQEAGGPKKFVENFVKILRVAQPVAMGMEGSRI